MRIQVPFQPLHQAEEIQQISPVALSERLASGWRHFGVSFFRYNYNWYQDNWVIVFPLRIRLADFEKDHKQQKIWRRNQRYRTEIRPISIQKEHHRLFELHKTRFSTNPPTSVFDFLSENPQSVPCKALEIAVYDGDKLIACSFLDLAADAVSSIYGMFDPHYSRFSLGIYTMLVEIEWAIGEKKAYYYHGYCYSVPSFYDYKKEFKALEYYDWKGDWHAVGRSQAV